MEADYQATLRGKIKILFQLEKWQDVSKLCEQYNEKFGKDPEIDMIRFKTDRHLGKATSAPGEKYAPSGVPKGTVKSVRANEDADEEEPLLLLTSENDALPDQARPIIPAGAAAVLQRTAEENLDYEPFPQANELLISGPVADSESIFNPDLNESSHDIAEPMIVDPSTENEQVLNLDYSEAPLAANTLLAAAPSADEMNENNIAAPGSAAPDRAASLDPIKEYEPMFSLAGNAPPVILEEMSSAGNVEAGLELPEDELAIIDGIETKPADHGGDASAFMSDANKTFDAEASPDPLPEAKPGLFMPSPEAGGGAPLASPFSVPDSDDRPAQVWQMPVAPEPREPVEENHFHSRESSAILPRKSDAPKKFVFNYKYLAVLVLPLAAAVVLWLALSGRLTQDGDADMNVRPVQVRPARKPATRRPIAKVPAVAPVPENDEKDQLVNENIIKAQGILEKGDAVKALAVVLEAKKIKVTDALIQLEKQVTDQLRENAAQAAEKNTAEIQIVHTEERDYADAVAENSIAALQKFLLQYPLSQYAARAHIKISGLEKQAAQKAEQEFQLKVRQTQRQTLRSDYVSLTQADLNAVLQKLGKPGPQFEQLTRGGEKVVVDFSSGLMWFLYSKPMTYDKASWWANRNYAGYSGWKLPTVEEVQSLQRLDTALYAGLKDFAVWTGDGVGDQVRSVWTCKLPSGQFSPENIDLLYYVWAVRKAAK